MFLEIVKIISINITFHATFVGCVSGKISVNVFRLVKSRLLNLKKLFAKLSLAELRQEAPYTILDSSAGSIVFTVKIVHPSFQKKVTYTKSSASSWLFTRQHAKR